MVRFKFIIVFLILILPELGLAQVREKVRVALGSISVSSSLFPIAQDVGIFPKYGIDMEPIYFGGGMNSIAAVTSNDVVHSVSSTLRPTTSRVRGGGSRKERMAITQLA